MRFGQKKPWVEKLEEGGRRLEEIPGGAEAGEVAGRGGRRRAVLYVREQLRESGMSASYDHTSCSELTPRVTIEAFVQAVAFGRTADPPNEGQARDKQYLSKGLGESAADRNWVYCTVEGRSAALREAEPRWK